MTHEFTLCNKEYMGLPLLHVAITLTAVLFETGAMPTSTKSEIANREIRPIVIEGVRFNHTYPFLRVFAISAFLKVIHAPQTPKRGYPENNLPTYNFSYPCNRDFHWTL